MRSRFFAGWLLVALAAAMPALSDPIRVLRSATGKVEVVAIEDYVAAVLPGEIGRAPRQALLAQAIAARSYALGHLGRHADHGADVCDSTHCQVYRGLRAVTRTSREAARATEGLVLSQQNRVMAAPFHANCGGHTTRPIDVWDDEEVPDLLPVEDDACVRASAAPWAFHLSRAQIGELGAKLGLSGARFFEVYGRDFSGRVSMVRLAAPGGAVLIVRGFDFRKSAMELWGWDSVRSTLFDFEERQSEYLVTGRGHGHGAGLCQAGAIQRAARGETFKEILKHYYSRADLTSLRALGNVVAAKSTPPHAPEKGEGGVRTSGAPPSRGTALQRVTAVRLSGSQVH
jgi:stage II sporulation protein D